MVMYFIASQCRNAHQNGTIECNEIKTPEQYNKFIERYKEHLEDQYGFKPEDVQILSLNRL